MALSIDLASTASTLGLPDPRFTAGRGYLAACTLGIPATATAEAISRDLERWRAGEASAAEYSAIVERARGHAATLLGTAADRVAVGSQVSAFVALAAASAPAGARIACVDGDFSSVVAPFLARGDLDVRPVPLARLADAITPSTWLVAFSLVQSATGEIADAASVIAAARAAGALVLVDTTQATGWMPTADLDADLVVCHAYKWLSAPRGAAFMAVSDRALDELVPITAGWYSGEDPWSSCYGPDLHLAAGARRFDVSPAWHAWAGAEAALELAAGLDLEAVRRYDVSLADAFRERLGLPPSASAIVSWPDAEGRDLAALTAAGLTASGRAGRARVAFHLWNDAEDVDLAARALGR
ncbi:MULTISPECIES: aminotransferase class V-fold PLP-dependent enzyme [unclassified Agromyces]|uniref:aminotransferase class V-fold PLP-dependent enzyme n=1 Tax=unclassified Agromyces TaxID=2639701 RepID=UPI0007B30637|nr:MULTISPECIES: aminotransferase class V-fold PLP-dependent enzyme [unclassified Agromyces]KZE94558.1 Isopenicillin N epimerase [Agromyces sp. NDB4Y10]MCK8610181.1 aminotransferase class V-fold PLP-dependent enzyme [Agromyces sp. C10]